MRIPVIVIISLLVSAAANAATDTNAQNLAAKCRAASFARRGPGTLSSVMRNAEIQRCIKNNGFLAAPGF
jgi:hypothetical protein